MTEKKKRAKMTTDQRANKSDRACIECTERGEHIENKKEQITAFACSCRRQCNCDDRLFRSG